MIEKLTYDSDIKEAVIDLTEKLNEVIDAVNSRAILEETDHPEVAEAAKKAAQTGSHADLKTWLDLRRKYL